MASLRQFISELRRRRVIRAVVIYLLVAWIVIQVGEATFPSLRLPEWTLTLVIAMAALGLPIVLVLAWAYDLQPREGKIVRSPEVGGDSESTNGRKEIESIAVLPFADMSPDADQEYFGDGIAEELLITLNNCCRNLRVPARSSSFSFKGRDLDAREIGAQLGVDALVEGSVRKSGEKVRITAQLIDVRDGFHLWSESYDRQLVDLFDIQDEIAQHVVDALDVSLSEKDRQAIGGASPADVRAYEYYLKGRQFFHQARKKSLEYAMEMFRRAVDVDPEYALAWAGVAESASHSTMLYPGGSSAQADLEEADRASRKALELDASLAQAHAARGYTLFAMQRFDEAQAEFETAIELDPKQFEARYYYGRACFMQGRLQDAARFLMEALDIREDREAAFFAAQSLEALGRHAEAKVQYRKGVEIATRHMELNPDDPRAATLLAVAHCRLEDPEEGLEWAERALAIDPEDAGVKYNVACLYAIQGESDKAIECLEQALQAGFGTRTWIENDPDLDSVREDPRFQALLARLQTLDRTDSPRPGSLQQGG